jgi:NADPH:quinone reductase-like Zn-dependent oxidoreductase
VSNRFRENARLKTVNIVRRPEFVAELEAIGGNVVVVDSPDVPDRIKVAIGQAKLRLALDGVSGPPMGVLAATLSPNGTLVSFAAMSEGPMSINRSTLSSNLSRCAAFGWATRQLPAKLAQQSCRRRR